jgi:cyclophilin family peptidyl-prolyl cis-trans isomerase
LEFIGELDHLQWDRGGAELLAATVAAGVSGYWSIAFLLRYLRNHSLKSFVLYRVALGAVILLTSCSPQSETPLPSGGDSAVKEQVQPPAINEALEITNDHLADITDEVVVRTSMGSFSIGLYGTDAPNTVENFLGLVAKKYYDGILIHRVAHHFVIQMGDRKTRERKARREWGRGGQTASGEPLAEELDPETKSAKMGYVHGVVAMARKPAPGTGTSQFFVCLDSAATLPLQYTIFGRVIDGLDVVDAIGSVDVEPGVLGEGDGLPKRPIRVYSIRKQ